MIALGKLLFGGTDSDCRLVNTGMLILRVFAGLAMALGHGLGKVPPTDRFVEGVGALGFPLPGLFAWAAGLAEFGGGILLAAGLLTRPASASILFTMGVAFFIRHAADPFGVKEKAFLFGAIALAFVIMGAGKYSMDHLVSRRSREI